ncbi:hypothetical protein VUR80DRAFT_6263 [Thermomyces stellatus]
MRHLESLREVYDLVDRENGSNKTEFRKVETMDLHIDKGLFADAKRNVEATKKIMPDVEVKICEAGSAKKVRDCRPGLTVPALRGQLALPWSHLIQGRCPPPLLPRHVPLVSPPQGIPLSADRPLQPPRYLRLPRLQSPIPGPYTQGDLSRSARRPRHERLRLAPRPSTGGSRRARPRAYDLPTPGPQL